MSLRDKQFRIIEIGVDEILMEDVTIGYPGQGFYLISAVESAGDCQIEISKLEPKPVKDK